MAFLEGLKETFDTGDPVVRTWPLVQSFWSPLVLCGLYVFFVKRLGPDLMRDRRPFDLRLFMIVYNFTIVLAYVVSLLTLIYYFLTTDAYRLVCTPGIVQRDHYTYTCSSVGWLIYILKYVEFADTVFFLLRKKDHLISNLHVIHHTVLPIMSWILLRTERSGFQFIPAGINSFVHVIMYTYYGLAAMGPEVQKRLWWKEYLTLLQMAQFVVILLFMFVVIPLSGCNTSSFGIYLDVFFAALFLALFCNFYKKTYRKKDSPNGLLSQSSAIRENNGKLLESNGKLQELNGELLKPHEKLGELNGKLKSS